MRLACDGWQIHSVVIAISVVISGAGMKYLIHFQSEDSCSYEMII